MTTVLKLGGSVITRKDEPETVDQAALEQACRALGDYLPNDGEPLVLVHGGGSFGHHHAAEHGVSSREGTADAAALLDIHRAMTRLNDVVVDELQGAGVAALPVRPLSMARKSSDGIACPDETVATMLSEGFVPVLHGDVVAHEGAGGSVLSGDAIVAILAEALAADRIGVCSTVPGVLDANDEVIPEITAYEDAADVLGGSDTTDVTGGMAAKVHHLLSLEMPASIFDLDHLETFLTAGTAGTTIK